jgi:hypothetical protein
MHPRCGGAFSQRVVGHRVHTGRNAGACADLMLVHCSAEQHALARAALDDVLLAQQRQLHTAHGCVRALWLWPCTLCGFRLLHTLGRPRLAQHGQQCVRIVGRSQKGWHRVLRRLDRRLQGSCIHVLGSLSHRPRRQGVASDLSYTRRDREAKGWVVSTVILANTHSTAHTPRNRRDDTHTAIPIRTVPGNRLCPWLICHCVSVCHASFSHALCVLV